MSDDVATSNPRTIWESAAPGWAKWENILSANLGEATDSMLEMAGVGPGDRVIDLACGAGHQSLRAARRVQAHGSVVATDISATMLSHVRKNAADQGLENVETIECSADDLGRATGPFDASICRLGLMLFPSPARVLSSVRDVLKPGASFATLVVTTPQNNAFLSQPMGILLKRAQKRPPGPGQPSLFALGGEGVLERRLKEADLQDVETKTLHAKVRLGSADEALEMMQEAFGAYRAVVADLDAGEQERAWTDVLDCLRQFEGAGGFEASFELRAGAGRKAAT